MTASEIAESLTRYPGRAGHRPAAEPTETCLARFPQRWHHACTNAHDLEGETVRTITNATGQSTIHRYCRGRGADAGGHPHERVPGRAGQSGAPLRRRSSSPTSSVATCRSSSSSSARPRARRTSRSAPASKASSTSSHSRKARSSRRDRCSTASIRSRFEASLANAKAELATWQARYVKTQNDVKRLEPLAAKQAVSAAGTRQRRRRRGAAAQAQVEAQNATVEQSSARPRLHRRVLARSTGSPAPRW